MNDIHAYIRSENARRGSENRKYGEGFEIRCLAKVKQKRGCLNACRSAGSRGLFDVIGYFATHTLNIVCKTNGYIEPKQRKALVTFFEKTRKAGFYRIEIHSKDEEQRRIIVKKVTCAEDIH